MPYKLIGSQRSPFVRLCRLAMIQNKIDFEFQAMNFVDDKSQAEHLAKETPINKVPILIDGNQKIFDSRIILQYLQTNHNLPALSLDQENCLTSIYSCLDTGVILFLMKRDGFNIDAPGFFLDRQRARIPANLEYLAAWASKLDAKKSEDWNILSMGLFSFLYWANAREVIKIGEYPVHVDFVERFKNSHGVQETSF
jgi:glutathione S-transferase